MVASVFWNKKAVYGLLFRASAKTVITIAADPKRMGARVGMTSVLHTWGSALTHHPHIHMIVPGAGLSPGDRSRVMRLATPEFIRRFLVHVLSDGFHRIQHYGLLASSTRKANITKIRALLCVRRPEQARAPSVEAEIIPLTLREPCPCCGGPMRIVEILRRGQKPMSRAPPREQAGRQIARHSSRKTTSCTQQTWSEQPVLVHFQRRTRRQ
jgi:hypothetical protein